VKPLPYNLNDAGRIDTLNKRIFNVQVNGQMLLDHFDMTQQYGMANAVVKSTTVSVTNGEGIYIDFTPIQGEPVLNALQLKKLDTQIEK
jgi:beta-galactosidase